MKENHGFKQYLTVPVLVAFGLGATMCGGVMLAVGPGMTAEGARRLAEAQHSAQAATARAAQAEADRNAFRQQLAAAIATRDSVAHEASTVKQQLAAVQQERDSAQRVLSGMQPGSGAQDSPQDQIIAYLFAHDSGSRVYVSSIAQATGMQVGLVNYYLQELVGKSYVAGDKDGVTIAEAGRAYWVKRNGM